MTHVEIRKLFTEFFVAKDHKLVPSSSLIPKDDPSVLLTTAGVQQFKPHLLGERDPVADFGRRRLCSIQKSFRTSDIDEVGDKDHLTFFEMLGNFSIGDYFKEEAIEWAFEFLTKKAQLDPQRMYVTVFAGEKDIPEDEESINIWKKVAGKNIRIEKQGRQDNFWGPTGDSGPCGPSSEIIYILDADREMELWNLVFTELFQDENGELSPLKQRNIDTGMGLERLTLVLQNSPTVFETDLFQPLITVAKDLAAASHQDISPTSLRILADHARAAAFLIADGVRPENTGRGYVLRRIIRRAVHQGRGLNRLAEEVIRIYGEIYPNLKDCQDKILKIIEEEERKFGQTLDRGLREFKKIVSKCQPQSRASSLRGKRVKESKISGKEAFKLYDTYGFPLDLTVEIAKEKGLAVDTDGFKKEMEKQQERARSAADIR